MRANLILASCWWGALGSHDTMTSQWAISALPLLGVVVNLDAIDGDALTWYLQLHFGNFFSFFMKCQRGDIKCYSGALNLNIHSYIR